MIKMPQEPKYLAHLLSVLYLFFLFLIFCQLHLHLSCQSFVLSYFPSWSYSFLSWGHCTFIISGKVITISHVKPYYCFYFQSRPSLFLPWEHFIFVFPVKVIRITHVSPLYFCIFRHGHLHFSREAITLSYFQARPSLFLAWGLSIVFIFSQGHIHFSRKLLVFSYFEDFLISYFPSLQSSFLTWSIFF